MFKAMKKHAHHKAEEKTASDLEEGGVPGAISSTSLGGSKNEEGVELIDHHHHGREMKVRRVVRKEGGTEGSVFARESREGKRAT